MLYTVPMNINGHVSFLIKTVKVLDCGIVLSEFELQSRNYFHFLTNTIRKGMNPLNLLASGQIAPLQFF